MGRERAAQAAVLAGGAALLALAAAAVPLSRLARQSLNASGGSVPVWVGAPFAVNGLVVAWRRPGNPLGWIMRGGAFFGALSEDASFYARVDSGGNLLQLTGGDQSAIISRTLGYAIVTGLLVGVYAGLVLLATQVLRVRSSVAVAAATLAAAALFNPVRHRVQRVVDRRFNRARYDADAAVAAFAARLKDAVDLDSVSDDLARAVTRSLEPAHLSVWISSRY